MGVKLNKYSKFSQVIHVMCLLISVYIYNGYRMTFKQKSSIFVFGLNKICV